MKNSVNFYIGLLIFGWSAIVFGQMQRPPVPQFSFMHLRLVPSNPAARPASLGGAFIGIADDATAAAINPAGLAFLSRPEISLSHAFGRQARDFPVGRGDREIGTRREINPIFDQTLVNIVYPQWGFTFGLYRERAFRSEFVFTRRQFLTIAPDRPLTLHEQLGAAGNFPGIVSDFSSDVIHNALAVAKNLHRRLRVGFTIAATEFCLRLHERHYFDPDLWFPLRFNNTPVRIGDNRSEGLYRIYYLEQNGFKTSFNFGIVVELDPNLNLGAVYQYLPAFKVTNHVTLPAYRLPDRDPDDGRNDEINLAPDEIPVPFEINLPDHFGIGLAWRLSANTLIAVDGVLHRNRFLFSGLNMDLPHDNTLTRDSSYVDPDGKNDVEAKDIFSFHAGIEHILAGKFPVRVGCYTEPNFGLQAISADMNLKKEYPDESAHVHFTSGIGVILKNVRFEGSIDISSTLIEAIGSAVVRF